MPARANCQWRGTALWPAWLALWLAFPAFAASPLTEGYPTLPLSLAVPFAANDQGNVFLDLFLPTLEKASPKPVSLRRLPGRGGGYALREILGKPADGHSLALLTLPSFFLQAIPPNRLYARGDFTPLIILAHAPAALWTTEESPLASVRDLIRLARSRETSSDRRVPDSEILPADAPLVAAGSGSYSEGQVAALLLARAAGIRIRYLPFLSTAKAAEAVRNGAADICFGYALKTPPLPGMRPLAVSAQSRVPALPATPTFRETGLEVVAGLDIGLAMPAGADPNDVAHIAEFFLRVLDAPDLHAALTRNGFSPLRLSPVDLAAFLNRREEEINAFLQDYPLFPR
ncbi:MAG: hypothetical protein LBP61_10180 [Desulfovibrio sp.]|jgi:tripartite-type tricarboxylate transporter receptor subunit TctC|nr:hypothetical protein [Desulfovibrio sp.]